MKWKFYLFRNKYQHSAWNHNLFTSELLLFPFFLFSWGWYGHFCFGGNFIAHRQFKPNMNMSLTLPDNKRGCSLIEFLYMKADEESIWILDLAQQTNQEYNRILWKIRPFEKNLKDQISKIFEYLEKLIQRRHWG